jgi:hypothetical protein
MLYGTWKITACHIEKTFLSDDGEPEGIFCIGYNITEYMDTKTRLAEIGYMQSHLVRRPLANIIGLAGILGSMQTSENTHSINTMLLDSASELDEVIRSISDKS